MHAGDEMPSVAARDRHEGRHLRDEPQGTGSCHGPRRQRSTSRCDHRRRSSPADGARSGSPGADAPDEVMHPAGVCIPRRRTRHRRAQEARGETDHLTDGLRRQRWRRRCGARARSLGRRFVLARSRPETALFRDLGVNLRVSLCGVQEYASAQILISLTLHENPSFLHRELRRSHRSFRMGTSPERLRRILGSLKHVPIPGLQSPCLPHQRCRGLLCPMKDEHLPFG